MGNRAVITTFTGSVEPKDSAQIGVYLHWNGGRDSVEAFLKYCKLKGYRSPETDSYGWARLCQVIGNFFGGGLSIGVGPCCNLDCDNFDNGTYIIKDWEIIDRKYFKGWEQNSHDLTTMLVVIDNAQPEKERLGDFLTATEISIEEVKLGDTVFFYDGICNKYEKCKVVGFGKNEYVNGVPTLNRPYVDKYGNDYIDCANNCNNYIRTDTIRIAERAKPKVKVKVKVTRHKINGKGKLI